MRRVVVAAALVVVTAACGAAASAPPIADNQLVLTRAQSTRLVHWLGTVRTCLARRGVAVGEIGATRKQLTLPVAPTLTARALAARAVTCAERLDGPPPNASLQAFRGRLILYLPKRCLLDPTVANGAGA